MRLSSSFLATAIIITASAASPALAGVVQPATPGPLLGAGIPAAAGLAYLYRRIRRSKRG
ncbi:hypothetical protein ASE86_14895 [Sphingomonas sp. Leaf33]|uniref:hypothetical protein n=1 Tax=Sphingomonas sp. Leaf33 TaxID=1736215 RepID=UPI0006FDC098|nr:hypothetical protein [Sphingomonas sp. Leaf33]KQN21249.1 hypothetical protein ASE86_14895 [Sphingomonas sp. Leaf33]